MKLQRLEISNARRRLSGRTERRGVRTGFPTWGAFAFGSVFVAVGGLVMLVGLRVIPVDPGGVHAPWWVLTVAGSVFALGGLAVWGMAGRQQAALKRRREAGRLFPREPAMVDYPWDPSGFEAPRWSRAASALAGAAALTLFLSIFNYWAFFQGGPWPVKAVVVLFDLVLLAVWWEAATRLGRAVKFGGSRLAYPHFPCRLGEPVRVQWQAAAGIIMARRGTFTLRCVEEWFEATGHGKNRTTTLVHEERWRATWHLDTPEFLRPGDVVELRFEPPADLPPTRLSADRPVFWECEVRLDLPGLDFEEIYLVPVYGSADTREVRS